MHTFSRWEKKMTKNRKKTTLKETIKAMPVPFVLLTLVLTVALNKLADYGLTQLLNKNNDHPLYTYQYSLDGELGFLLVIPAATLSIFICKWILSFKKQTKNASATDNNKHVHQVHAVHEPTKSSSERTKRVKKVSKVAWSILLAIVTILFKVTHSIVNSMNKSIGRNVESTMTGWMSSINSALDENAADKKAKEEARFQADQKQKDADYAWKHTAKQWNYNSNTHHFDEKFNRAQRKQREADEARKEERKL